MGVDQPELNCCAILVSVSPCWTVTWTVVPLPAAAVALAPAAEVVVADTVAFAAAELEDEAARGRMAASLASRSGWFADARPARPVMASVRREKRILGIGRRQTSWLERKVKLKESSDDVKSRNERYQTAGNETNGMR
jgi:hypothetical protein